MTASVDLIELQKRIRRKTAKSGPAENGRKSGLQEDNLGIRVEKLLDFPPFHYRDQDP